MRSQGKPLSARSETQVNTELPTQKSTSRKLQEQLSRKTLISDFLEAQSGQVWEAKTPEGSSHMCDPTLFVNFISWGSTRLSQWLSEKNPLLLLTRVRKRNHLQHSSAFCPYKVYPQEKQSNHSLILLGFSHSLTDHPVPPGHGNVCPSIRLCWNRKTFVMFLLIW